MTSGRPGVADASRPAPAPDTDRLAQRIETDGYVIVEGLLGPDRLAPIRETVFPLLETTDVGDNSFLGYHTRRRFGLLSLTRVLDQVVTSPVTTALAGRLIGPHQLTSLVAIRIDPGERAQTLHTDASAWPLPSGAAPVVLNSIWALDDFTAANGATRLVPGSHRRAERPGPEAAVVTAEMPAGSVLLYHGDLWHGGGANTTAVPRVGLVVEYAAAWLRPQENFALSFPPALARHLDPALAALLGYELYPPFVGHVGGRPPTTLLE